MEARIFIGLGGNAGDVRQTFRAAMRSCYRLLWVSARHVRVSPIWESAPVGPVVDQPPFLNMCIEIEPIVSPAPVDLMTRLLQIEHDLGRDRAQEMPQGPRPIDLDLLLWGDRVIDDPGPPAVRVPHPRLHERAFALAPLVALAGEDLVIPGPGGGRAGDLLRAALATQSIRLLA